MLKLTNSFYRYLWLTFDNLYSIHVRKSTHFSSRRKLCSFNNITQSVSLLEPSNLVQQQLRQCSNLKKRLLFKKQLQKANEPKKSNQMSESLQPTVNHVSYGGRFQITASDESQPSSNEWRKNSSEDNVSDNTSTQVNKVKIPQDFRVWETVNKKCDKYEGTSFKFKVVSYNVLAQYLLECHPYLYTDCSSYDLKWKVRSARLYDEILKLAPDILCLQEVQATHLETFYHKFEQIGYFGIFKQKTGHRHDGCAIYFRQDIFQMVDHVSVEFFQPELPILNRDNIGIIVKLMPKSVPDSTFIVATTHLLYNPKRTDVRLAQIQVFLAEIDRFAYSNKQNEPGHLPIILTGDFNSTPDSAVVRLLDKGHVSAGPFRDSSDWKRIGVTDNCQHLSVYLSRQRGDLSVDNNRTKIYNSDHGTESIPDACERDTLMDPRYDAFFNSAVIGHSLQLTSAYDRIKNNGQFEATTFQDYWVTVDYIYFSRYSNMRLVERLRLPTTYECNVLGRLPNEEYASDHLALGAVFEIKPPRKSSL